MIRIVIRGRDAGPRTLEFTTPVVRVGRKPGNDVVLDHPNVSARHAELRIHPAGLEYVDLASTNGSFVRRRTRLIAVDAACHHRLVLEEGDEILFGDPVRPLVLSAVGTGEAVASANDDDSDRVDVAETVDASNPDVLSALSDDFDRAALLALHRFTEQSLGERDLDRLLERFAEVVLALFSKAHRVTVHLREDGEFRPRLARDRHGRCPFEAVSRTLGWMVAERGQAVLFSASDEELNDASSLHRSNVSVGLCAPLRDRSATFGLAQIDCRGQLVPFDQGDLRVFTVLAHQLALQLENLRLNHGLQATVSDLERARVEMERLAFEDSLTGLANRRLFRDRLEQALRTGRRNARQCAVLYLDLDDFKRINDSLGHDAGDELLCIVAGRLRGCVRGQDTVARLGGDEFVLLLTEVGGAEAALRVAHKVLAALREPIRLRTQQLVMTTSVGITLAPDDADDAETLLKYADLALYRAKGLGQDTAQFFSAEMKREAAERLELEGELRGALERAEFVLHYQPVWSLAGGPPWGVEALVRWRHPSRGLLLPEAFVPFAEECGLIVPISEWVLRTACEQITRVQASTGRSLTMSVNVSPRQFTRGDLASVWRSVLAQTATRAGALQVEITETMLMHDIDAARRTLDALRAMGVTVAVDDFGTGYSSLSYLADLPLDVLKIDRRFVRGIGVTGHDGEIAAAIIALARTLGLSVVAEGIETPAQLEFLRHKGCPLGQGFLLGRPGEFDRRWLASPAPGTTTSAQPSSPTL